MTNEAISLPSRLQLVRSVGPIVGAGGIALGLVLSFVLSGGINMFFQGMHYAFWILLSLSLGSTALIMIHHMTAGGWSFVSQRIFEAFMRTLPVPLVMFAVIWLGTMLDWHTIFSAWTHPEGHVVPQKAAYLNKTFWSARAALYFGIWFAIVYLFNGWSKRLEETGDALITLKFRKVAPVALITYCATMTFAAVDWGQSIEAEWFSTIYAPLTWISHGLTTFAVTIILLDQLSDQKPLSRYLTVEHLHTISNLMCAFIVIWTYMSFAQFLIIWAGNLPEEIHYYLDRAHSTFYQVVIGMLMVGHFFIPFMVLMQRRVTYNVSRLLVMCWFIVCMRLVDVFFWFNPAYHPGDSSVPWRDILVYACVLAGFAGVYFWVFLGQLTRASLLPMNDPRMHEALDPGHGHSHGEEGFEHA
jgi:hypothetical protein